MNKQLFSVSPKLVKGAELPYRVTRNSKAFLHVDTEPKARQVVAALNSHAELAASPEASRLLSYQAVMSMGVQLVLPLAGELPGVMITYRKKAPDLLTGDLLLMGYANYHKPSMALVRKAYGAEAASAVEALMLTEAVALGIYQATNLTVESPAEPESPVKVPKKAKKDPTAAKAPPAKPATVKKVSDAWKANQGENWPDPQA